MYRYVNAVPLIDAQDRVRVNWVEITVSDDKGKVTFHGAFVTDHLITEQNVEAGRCRWSSTLNTPNLVTTMYKTFL